MRKTPKPVVTTQEQKKENDIVFMDKMQTFQLIMGDKDNYISGMGDVDLRQRLSVADTTMADARDKYRTSSAVTAVDFLEEEKKAIVVATKRADDHLRAQDATLDTKIASTPWVFAVTEGNVYENGEPHIRHDNVIMLSTRTLAEEAFAECQLAFTLLYLRMAVFYPQQRDNARPLYVDPTKFPRNWALPTCNP